MLRDQGLEVHLGVFTTGFSLTDEASVHTGISFILMCVFFNITESDNRVWTDSAEEYVRKDPLRIHGTKAFWIISTAFVILWVVAFVLWK